MDDESMQRALLMIHYQATLLNYMSFPILLEHQNRYAVLLKEIACFFPLMQDRVELLKPETQVRFINKYKLQSHLELSFCIALAYELYKIDSNNTNVSTSF